MKKQLRLIEFCNKMSPFFDGFLFIFRRSICQIYCTFLNTFFPIRCVDCGEFGEGYVCYECIQKIEKIRTSTCPGCGKITKYGEFCAVCRRKNMPQINGIISAASFEYGPVREMVHHLKYSGFLPLADVLGELLVERLRNRVPKGKIVVIPVPLHPKREAKRGFNQSELLARYISKRLDFPGGYALEKVKNTESQVNLSGKERRNNLEGAFRCEDGGLIYRKTVLLVDDIVTTGATLNECAKVLKENGAKSVWGVVVAKR